MFSAITIFLIIGLGHWASHILQCYGCRVDLVKVMGFFLEGANRVFGWPFFVIAGVVDYFYGPKKPDQTSFTPLVENSEQLNLDLPVLTLTQNKGESFEEFVARAKVAGDAYIANKNKRGKNGSEGNSM